METGGGVDCGWGSVDLNVAEQKFKDWMDLTYGDGWDKFFVKFGQAPMCSAFVAGYNTALLHRGPLIFLGPLALAFQNEKNEWLYWTSDGITGWVRSLTPPSLSAEQEAKLVMTQAALGKPE